MIVDYSSLLKEPLIEFAGKNITNKSWVSSIHNLQKFIGTSTNIYLFILFY